MISTGATRSKNRNRMLGGKHTEQKIAPGAGRVLVGRGSADFVGMWRRNRANWQFQIGTRHSRPVALHRGSKWPRGCIAMRTLTLRERPETFTRANHD